MVIWYIFSFLVNCTKKNLATLSTALSWRMIFSNLVTSQSSKKNHSAPPPPPRVTSFMRIINNNVVHMYICTYIHMYMYICTYICRFFLTFFFLPHTRLYVKMKRELRTFVVQHQSCCLRAYPLPGYICVGTFDKL
jgi:hypothetical protein